MLGLDSRCPGDIGLACMLSPKRLDLAMCQVQDSMGLTHISDLKRLKLTVNQVQDNYQSSLGMFRESD